MFRKTSLGTVGVVIGLILAAMGFWAYGTGRSTLNLVGFFYGIPILLGGLALRSAELAPVLVTPPTSEPVARLRESAATATQNQIRKDVTRFRYGEDAHLAVALDYLGLSPTDEERPILQALREEDQGGQYALVLTFDSPLIPVDTWKEKQDKIGRFFGPNLRAELSQTPTQQIEVALITDPDQKARPQGRPETRPPASPAPEPEAS